MVTTCPGTIDLRRNLCDPNVDPRIVLKAALTYPGNEKDLIAQVILVSSAVARFATAFDLSTDIRQKKGLTVQKLFNTRCPVTLVAGSGRVWPPICYTAGCDLTLPCNAKLPGVFHDNDVVVNNYRFGIRYKLRCHKNSCGGSCGANKQSNPSPGQYSGTCPAKKKPQEPANQRQKVSNIIAIYIRILFGNSSATWLGGAR